MAWKYPHSIYDGFPVAVSIAAKLPGYLPRRSGFWLHFDYYALVYGWEPNMRNGLAIFLYTQFQEISSKTTLQFSKGIVHIWIGFNDPTTPATISWGVQSAWRTTWLKKNNLKNICGFWQIVLALERFNWSNKQKFQKLMIWETQQKLRLERKWHSKPQMMKK